MDDTTEILDRLGRIDALTRGGAARSDVLAEVRGLLAEGRRASAPAERVSRTGERGRSSGGVAAPEPAGGETGRDDQPAATERGGG